RFECVCDATGEQLARSLLIHWTRVKSDLIHDAASRNPHFAASRAEVDTPTSEIQVAQVDVVRLDDFPILHVLARTPRRAWSPSEVANTIKASIDQTLRDGPRDRETISARFKVLGRLGLVKVVLDGGGRTTAAEILPRGGAAL